MSAVKDRYTGTGYNPVRGGTGEREDIRGEGYRLREKRLGEQYVAAIRAEASAIKGGSIFLRSTAGSENGNKLSSVMAGVARSKLPQGSASATKPYARSEAYATSANLHPPTL